MFLVAVWQDVGRLLVSLVFLVSFLVGVFGAFCVFW